MGSVDVAGVGQQLVEGDGAATEATLAGGKSRGDGAAVEAALADGRNRGDVAAVEAALADGKSRGGRRGATVGAGKEVVLSRRKKVEREIIDPFKGIEPPRSLRGDMPHRVLPFG
ncbi:hypothetical protein BHM03_00060843 [Ensete ventricosum]|nr:hypothetical protein BHM03_00060843 [Ensete ventricosum]